MQTPFQAFEALLSRIPLTLPKVPCLGHPLLLPTSQALPILWSSGTPPLGTSPDCLCSQAPVRPPPTTLVCSAHGVSRIAGACFRARAPEEQGLSPGSVSASWLQSMTCWKGKEGRLRGLPVGEDLCLLLGGSRPLRAHQLRKLGHSALERGPCSRPSFPSSPSPSVEPAELTKVAGKMSPHPSKLLHICAQTKPAINPSFCVSVWVLNSTWICQPLEGEIGGDLVTTKGTH